MEAFDDQHGYRVRMEWGPTGLATLAPHCHVLVVVDVLSFSTAVDIAVSREAEVIPLTSRPAVGPEGAVLADSRSQSSWSLSPASLVELPAGTRLALPSPNGGRLSAAAAASSSHVLAGCLRNAPAVAAAAAELAGPDGVIGVLAAGERWPDGSLRPAAEDLLGAGAVITCLGGHDLSPEALAAADAFAGARLRGLASALNECVSGRELAAMGYQADVELAGGYGVSSAVPALKDGVYTG